MSKSMTRRDLLAGTATVALAGAAMSQTAFAAQNTAAESSMGYDGTGAMPWLGEAPEIADADVEEELDADVLVIGLGAAGVPALRAAAEAGAKVVAFEASPNFNSVASDMAILGGETQGMWGRGEGYIDRNLIISEHMKECSHHGSYEIINRWADVSGQALDWFVSASPSLYFVKEDAYEEIPEEGQSNYMFPYCYPVPETYDWTKEDMPCYPTSVGFSNLHQIMGDNLQVALDAGADVRFNTRGIKLITNEDGSIAGAYGKPYGSDKFIKVNAPAVILAPGDYLANEEMMKFYAPQCVENDIQILSLDFDEDFNHTNVGDGHKMGAWIGGAIEQWHAPVIHHMGGGAGPDGGVIGNNGYLWLNLRGKRFMNEDLPGQQLENQVEIQPQRKAYQFFDSKWPEQLAYFPMAHGVACIYRDEPLPSYTASGLRINVRTPEDIQSAVEDGRALVADTIDELLAQIPGMNVEVAKASIERYNELCHEGVDKDFGKSAQRLFALENPPYYVAECGTALTLGNLGGFESDADCHVYNTDRELIPGLYVCGAPQGGRFNVQYPISLKGLSCGMCMVFGMIAGQNAAKLA